MAGNPACQDLLKAWRQVACSKPTETCKGQKAEAAIPEHCMDAKSLKSLAQASQTQLQKRTQSYLTTFRLCLSMLLGTMPAAPTSLGWVRLGRVKGVPAFTLRFASAALDAVELHRKP